MESRKSSSYPSRAYVTYTSPNLLCITLQEKKKKKQKEKKNRRREGRMSTGECTQCKNDSLVSGNLAMGHFIFICFGQQIAFPKSFQRQGGSVKLILNINRKITENEEKAMT